MRGHHVPDAQTASQAGGKKDHRAALASHKTDSRSADRLWPAQSGQFKTIWIPSLWIPSRHVARSFSRSTLTCAPLSGTRRQRICSRSTDNGTGQNLHERGPQPSVAHTLTPCGDAWACVLSEMGARMGRPPPSSVSLARKGPSAGGLSRLVEGRTPCIGSEIASARARIRGRR